MAESENTVEFHHKLCTTCRVRKPVIHIAWGGESYWDNHSYTKCLECYVHLMDHNEAFRFNVEPRIRELFAK